tara:strand:- start:676 stop:1809 length:1134 start_codon:yes stop_codon:yes gene_type:complete
MLEHFPEKDTEEARDGTAAHWVSAHVLETWKNEGGKSPILHAAYLGNSDPDGTIITNEMLEGAEMYADEIAAVMDFASLADPEAWGKLQIEQRVYATEWVHPDNWGTVDAWYYDAATHTLYIWDFKFGFLDIPAFENMQLVDYYAGIAQGLGINGDTDQTLNVVMQAVQPRCFSSSGPIKEWKVLGSDLRSHINILRTAAAEARGPEPRTISGKQCRYCPARHGCKSAGDAAMAGVDYIHRAHPEILTNDAVSFELATLTDAKKAIEYRLEAMEDEAQSRLSAGQFVPGFKMKVGQGRRKWAKDTAVIQNVGALSGVDLIENPKPVTPFQAEKKLRDAGFDKDSIESTLGSLIVTPSSGMKVVKDDGSEARRIFSQQ